jgi:amino acid adenylation domain-containing protein/non-ribosomal peptide synthase protein (TIGR01720 family)
MIKNPSMQIKDIDYLSELDRDQIFYWNREWPETVAECAHDMIKRQMVLQPDAPAIASTCDGDFTYGELDNLSTPLAHYFVQLGVGPEVIVPLCFEKSAWAVVVLLGVIKAGGTVVFLDPSHPMSRLEEILSQVKSKFVVTSPTTDSIWTSSPFATAKITREFIEGLPAHPHSPSTNVNASNSLYVVFTSGTTGKPKGCIIEHRNFCSGAMKHAEGSNMGPGSRVSQFASYTFDVSILEIITALMVGACICVTTPEDLIQGLASVINKFGITWTFLTPSLCRLLSPGDVPALRTLALGGEALSTVDVETWADKLQLINGYGPSECSIAAAGNSHVSINDDPRNIGRAYGGVCWIVDAEDHDRLVPVGVIGELLIQGPILARGYLHNPTKTEEVFVEDLAWSYDSKYSGMPRRFYKTGDLVRYNADGTIHFVGRKDTQIKLRGQRIELSEIEHHLAVKDDVALSIVVLAKSGFCKQKIVAIFSLASFPIQNGTQEDHIKIISNDPEVISEKVQHIQDYLSDLVPTYMVPTIWIPVEGVPLMTSGKLNRRKVTQWVTDMDEATYLKLVGVENRETEEDALAGTESERLLQEVFSSVLNLSVDQIPLNRSFLSLGGDSISAMQVVARCREHGRSLSIKDILRSKTISALSLCVGDVDGFLTLEPERFDTPFALSPVQQMYMFFAAKAAKEAISDHFNQSFFLRVARNLSESTCDGAIDAVVKRHSMLRSHFSMGDDGQWTQRIPEDTKSSYAVQHHRVQTLRDAAPVITATHKTIDVLSGPIFAAHLFTTDNGDQYLFLVAHHLVVDLVSWRIIMRDLEKLVRGEPLPSVTPIPFQTWLDLQATYAAEHLNAATVLPFSIPSPKYDYWGMADQSNKFGDIIEEIFSLDLENTRLLLGSKCHEALTTEPIDLLLAALIHSFSLVFNDRDTPAIFREGHGREPWTPEIDLSGTVGWFTTMYPLYISGRDRGIIDIVRRAKDTRHNVPGNGWPYFASRFLNDEGRAKFASHNDVEISFDYLGRYQQLEKDDALFKVVPREDYAPTDVGSDTSRFMLVEITAEVVEERMQYQFLYNRHMAHGAKIRQWISQCKDSLNIAIEKLLVMPKQHSLSDFPLLRLTTYEQLTEMLEIKLPESGISNVEDIEDIYPVAPMQRGLLLSQLRLAESYKYFHTFEGVSRRGDLDVDKFIRAWCQVVSRHPVLRTQFVESSSPDSPYDQVVLKKIDPWIVQFDCSSEDVSSAFEQQPPVTAFMGRVPHRLTICTTPSKRVFGKLDLNHAIIDGASLPIMFKELALAWDGKLPAEEGYLFNTYVNHINNFRVDESINYWKQYLEGLEPCRLELEQPNTTERQLNTVKLDLNIDQERLHVVCEQHGVTIANILQTAWGLVLRQYTSMQSVSFGYLSSGRDTSLPGIEGAVGPFLTMLVCRLDFDLKNTLVNLLDKTRDDTERSLSNQYCALADIQHGLGFSEPLFNTVMSVQRRLETETIASKDMSVILLEEHDPTEVCMIKSKLLIHC